MSSGQLVGLLLGGVVVLAVIVVLATSGGGAADQPAAAPPAATAAAPPSAHEICFNQLMTAMVNFSNGYRNEMAVNGDRDPFFLQATYLSALYKTDVVQFGREKAEANNADRVDAWCTQQGDPRRETVDDNGT